MKKIIALLIAAVLSVGAVTPARALEVVIVTGTVKTIDGLAIAGLSMSFSNNATSTSTSLRVSADGKFVVQIPEGDYSINISSTSSPGTGICLRGHFKKTITKSNSTLNINLPRLRTYEFKFVDTLGNFVPVIRLSTQSLRFALPENPDIQDPYFYCTMDFPGRRLTQALSFDSILWESFEIAGPSNPSEATPLSYEYISALGQSIRSKFALGQGENTKIEVTLSDIPVIDLSLKNLRISKTAVVGFATFSQAPAFAGIAVDSTFRTSVRALRKGKWTSWVTQAGKAVLVSSTGRVLVNVPTKTYKGETIEVAISGLNFNAASQVVRIKVPK